MDDTTPMKVCAKCGEAKPFPDGFYRKKSGKDGYAARCRSCMTADCIARAEKHVERERERKSRHYQEHKADYQARMQRRREEHPQENKQRCRAYYRANRERQLVAGRARYAATPEKFREQSQRYAEAHQEEARTRARLWHAAHPKKSPASAQQLTEEQREKRRARYRRWTKANPEKVRQIRARRRAWKAAAPVNDFTAEQWVATVEYFAGCCGYCGKPCDELTQEHLTPLSRGGAHSASNIVLACRPCNSKKGDKTLIELLLYVRAA